MPYFCAHAANPQIWLPMFEASSDMRWLFSHDSDCCKKSCVSKSCEKPCQDLLLVAALIGAVSMSGFSPQSSSELCYVPVPGYEPQSWNDWLAFLAWLQPSHFAVDISGDLDHQIANPAYLAGHFPATEPSCALLWYFPPSSLVKPLPPQALLSPSAPGSLFHMEKREQLTIAAPCTE